MYAISVIYLLNEATLEFSVQKNIVRQPALLDSRRSFWQPAINFHVLFCLCSCSCQFKWQIKHLPISVITSLDVLELYYQLNRKQTSRRVLSYTTLL